MHINDKKLGASITVVGRVTSLDDDGNGAIVEDHDRVECHIKLPPRSSSLDVVKNQVYTFYGVVAPLHQSGQASADHCLEVIHFSVVKEVDLKLHGRSTRIRQRIIKEMDDVAGNVVEQLLSQLDQGCQASGDWKDGVWQLVASERESDARRTDQCKERPAEIFVCGSDPDNPNVKKKLSLGWLATDIAKKVYQVDSAQIQDTKARCSTKSP